MRRFLVVLSAAVAVLAVSAPGLATAAGEKVLTKKTLKVKPSGKTARLTIVQRSGGALYLTLSVKVTKNHKSTFRELDRAKLKKKLPAGAKLRPLQAGQAGEAYEANGGQGAVIWDGATKADDYSAYFGFNLVKKRVELF